MASRHTRVPNGCFQGSPIMYSFGEQAVSAKQAFRMRRFEQARIRENWERRQARLIGAAECIVESARHPDSLRQLLSIFPDIERQRASRTFQSLTSDMDRALDDGLAAFSVERDTQESLKENRRNTGLWRRALMPTSGRCYQRITKLRSLTQVWQLRGVERRPHAEIAKLMRLPPASVRGLWAQLLRTKGCGLEAEVRKIGAELAQERALTDQLEARRGDQDFLGQPLRVMHLQIRQSCAEISQLPFNRFYQRFRELGFRYRPILYGHISPKIVTQQHLQDFTEVFKYFLLTPAHFEVVFFDESSLNPLNFKKRRWRGCGDNALTKTRIRYERIMMLGAMTREKVLAAQILLSSFTGQAFAQFFREALRPLLQQSADHRQLVVFLDNCPGHHAATIKDFCREHHIVLLFNLPHRSELNPIEHMWEFIKRPFRGWTTYAE